MWAAYADGWPRPFAPFHGGAIAVAIAIDGGRQYETG